MIIECTNCQSKYQYDESRFERRPSKKIRCAKCQQVFEVQNPAYVAVPEVDRADMTIQGRPRTLDERMPFVAPDPLVDDSAARAKREIQSRLPDGKRLSLAIINGPDSGKVFRMEKSRVVIGRSSADFILNDSESSRAHAAVEARDPLIVLEDLGSTNGTLVDGERIQRPVQLQNQSEFVVGATTLMLIVTDEA